MSSPHIRSTLTTWFNRLRGYVATTRAIVDAAAGGQPPDAALLVELRRQQQYIGDVVAKIEAKQRDWEQLLGNVAEERRAAEQAQYEEYQVDGVNFVQYLDTVEELRTQIRIIVRESVEANSATSGGRSSRASSISLLSAAGRAARAAPAQPPPPLPQVPPQLHSRPPSPLPLNPPAPPPPTVPAAILAGHVAPILQAPYPRGDPLRLPRLELRKFSGDPRQWLTFWQCFAATVHSQPISNVFKQSHLLTVLEGAALKAVEAYPVDDANYDVVLGVLRRRFGNTRAIADALEAELINMPRAGDSISSLRDTFEAIERVCMQFAQLGLGEDSVLLMTTTKSKLPRHVIIDLIEKEEAWQAAHPGRTWGMKEVREAVARYIAIREEANRAIGGVRAPTAAGAEQQSRNRDHRRYQAANAATRTFAANTVPADQHDSGQGRKRGPPECFLCGKDPRHWATDCTAVTRRDERLRVLDQQDRCQRCLRRGHKAGSCPTSKKCSRCEGNHHVLICSKAPGTGHTPNSGGNSSRHFKKGGGEVGDSLLMTCRVPVTSEEGKTANALVFFDPGSQTSFATQALLSRLGVAANGASDELQVYPFGSRQPTRVASSKHQLRLQCQNGEKEQITVHSAPLIGTRLATTDGAAEPDVLIGLRDFWRFFIRVEKKPKGAVVVHTTLGKVLCGYWKVAMPWRPLHAKSVACHAVSANHSTNHVDTTTRDFWALETIGVRDDPQVVEDDVAVELVDKSIRRWPDGRYAVGWPWRERSADLPSNFNMAFSRLVATVKKLMVDPRLAAEYDAIIRQQLQDGVIEPAVARAREGKPGAVVTEHFLPHHPVITHKTRIVYDASAHTRGEKSLNQCLLRGPALFLDLLGFLLRFRAAAYPVLADLEKAFLQIALHDDQREVAKFLWVKDVNEPVSAQNLQTFRFTRVAFGVISSPFLLASVIKHHLRLYQQGPSSSTNETDGGGPGGATESQLAAEIERNIYVDNVLLTADSTDEALWKARVARSIFAEAKMNLREFCSNAPEFMSSLPEEQRLDKAPKVLGLPWQLSNDTLRIDFTNQPLQRLSRRTVLKSLAGTFDPLGLVCPVLLPAKLFFQSLWDKERLWDTLLSDDEQKMWRAVEEQWVGTSIIHRRRTAINGSELTEIHAFVDASKDAYACAVYLLHRPNNGPVSCELAFAKSRLRPKGVAITIPRMELLAMLIGIRALTTVATELNLSQRKQCVWGDSKVVLAWLNSTEQQPRFVANRLDEIRLKDDVTFRYIYTKLNPADLATRGCSAAELQKHQLWWHGPHWLCSEPTEWPNELALRIEPHPFAKQLPVAVFATATPTPEVDWTGSVANRWPWHKWARIYAFVIRFANRCRGKTEERQACPTPSELEAAATALHRLAQVGYESEVRKRQLRIGIDNNGLVHLKTRILNSTLAGNAKHPLLLMKGSPRSTVDRECLFSNETP